ncbi:MAG TPA: ABC transporter substrate-binding protein [Chloroflexota bacterium]|nr:ABC transporter substrate-binding protein [Chloroflexota bacterium]
MPRSVPRLGLWLLGWGLLLSLAPAAPPGLDAAVGAAPVAAAQGGTTPVRVGTLGIIADAPVYIAADRGYFAEQGLAPTLERFDTGAQMVAPMAAGQLDAGAGTPAASLFNAIGRDLPLRIVADNARVAPGRSHIVLVARPDLVGSSLRDYADLRGLRVAVNARGTGTEIQLDRALARGGLTLADVDLQEVPFPDMLPALANRSLDAGITLEPFLALGLARGVFEVFHPVGDFYPDQQIAVLLYSPQFAAQTDAANRFMVAYLRGLRDFADAFYRDVNREQIVDILARNTVVQDRSLYATMVPHQVDRNGQVNRESLAADLDWYAAHGYLTGEKPDLNTVIDMRFVDYALGQLGRQ